MLRAALGFQSLGSGWNSPTGIREKPAGGELRVGGTGAKWGALGREGCGKRGGMGEGWDRDGTEMGEAGLVVMVLQGWCRCAVVTQQ